MAEEFGIADDVSEVSCRAEACLLENGRCLPPCESLGDGDAGQHGLAADEFVQNLIRGPARIQEKASGLQFTACLAVPREKTEPEGIGDDIFRLQGRGRTGNGHPRRYVEGDGLPRCLGGDIQEGIGLIAAPEARGCDAEKENQKR